MKITLSVGGRFHAFYLAQQLLKRGYLERLITSYPKFEVAKYGIPREKIRSVIIKEILERSWTKLPKFLRDAYNPQYFIHEVFDHAARRRVIPTDIFVGWSNYSLYSLKRAKGLGAIGIIDQGGSHVEYQRDILMEEYVRFGLKPKLIHPKIFEKALQEFEEADYISIPSLFVKRTFLEKGIPESKLIHVPYGVNLSQFQQIPKKDDVFRIVFAGGMILRKGVHYLLQAFSELKLPNSELLLIGSMNNEMKPFFKKYKGSYKYIGHVPQKELYKYYSQGSVFIIMSIEEGFGMVMIQAMACGLPVICTTNTGGEDIVRNGKDGFIIPIRNVDALKEKIIYLYENPEACRQMGQSAKERASSGFTWNDYGEKIIATYERILEESR